VGAWDETARVYGRGFVPLVLAALAPAFASPLLGDVAARRVSLAAYVAVLALALVGPLALVLVAERVRVGAPAEVGQAYLGALRRAPRLVAAGVILFVLLLVPLAVVSSLFARGGDLTGLRFAMFLAAIFVLVYRFLLIVPAIAIGRCGAWAAIGRSWSLVKCARLRFVPFAALIVSAEAVPGAIEDARPSGAMWLLISGGVAAAVMPLGSVAMCVSYDRLTEKAAREELSWLPPDELEQFAAATERRGAGTEPESGWRPTWIHLLLVPLLISVPGLLTGQSWGDVLFFVSLPFLLAFFLCRGIARVLADD